MMRNIDNIIIHCSDTSIVMDIGAKEIDEWHKERGWSGIGYHYVIRRNGVIEMGRDLDKDGKVLEHVGAHVQGYNKNSIGICWVGGRYGIDNRTNEQKVSMKTLVLLLKELFSNAEIKGHNEFNPNKLCPSFDVQEWLSTFNK